MLLSMWCEVLQHDLSPKGFLNLVKLRMRGCKQGNCTELLTDRTYGRLPGW